MINKVKSVVLFRRNTQAAYKREVCDKIEVVKETMNERYLGLLVHVGRSIGGTFAHLCRVMRVLH
jgi:hypothetical protein